MQKFFIIQRIENNSFTTHTKDGKMVFYSTKREALKEIASKLEEGFYVVVPIYSKTNF